MEIWVEVVLKDLRGMFNIVALSKNDYNIGFRKPSPNSWIEA